MIKNLYSCLKNMLRHFSNDILGDDSLNDIQQFINIKKKYNKKKNYFYILGLIMVIYIYIIQPPPTKDIALKFLGVDEP